MRTRTSLGAAAIVAVVLFATGCTGPVENTSFGNGSLGLQGASVTIRVTVKCNTDWSIAYGSATVAQANGSKLAQGFGTFENTYPGTPCTGSPQTATIVVFNSSPWVFRQGIAAVRGDVTVFNPVTGEFSTNNIAPQEIKILRVDPQPDPQRSAQRSRDLRFKQA